MGNLYSLQSDPNTILSHGSKIDVSTVVEVNCEKGYYKNSQVILTMVCLQAGQWSITYSNICLSKCLHLYYIIFQVFDYISHIIIQCAIIN